MIKKWQQKASAMALLKGAVFNTGLGAVTGYCLGNYLKQVSDIAIFYGGCAASFLGILAWHNWIKINWRVIKDDIVEGIVHKAAYVEGGLQRAVLNFMFKTGPLMASFSAGFWTGFTGELPAGFH